jgi:GNAT superfamily N-acetyltransferase
MAKVRYFAASIDDKDCAIMSVEELDGDFGAKIWLGGCWVNPDVRGTGVMKAMVDFIDSVAVDRNWQCQGLGATWTWAKMEWQFWCRAQGPRTPREREGEEQPLAAVPCRFARNSQ